MFPFFLPKVIKRGGYFEKLKHRFGHYPKIEPIERHCRIWIQVVSVGELQAATSVILALLSKKKCQLFITTTTTTAHFLLKKRWQNEKNVWIGFFPFDFVLFTKRAWRCVRPDLVLLFESELWPEHLYQAKCHAVPVWLLNARYSDRTYQRYVHFPYVAKWLYGFLDRAMFVSEKQKRMLFDLGIEAKKSSLMGQLKFDIDIEILTIQKIDVLKKQMGFVSTGEKTLYLLGSSTWPGEEEILLKALKSMRDADNDVRLILVPRHIERGRAIVNLVKHYGFSWSMRSNQSYSSTDVVVHIADTIGEIQMLSQCADLALVGKSFSPHRGGQTPLELACLGVPMVYGPNMSNFREICEGLEAGSLSERCLDEDQAICLIVDLLANVDSLVKKRALLQAWSHKNKGALKVVIEQVNQFFAEEMV